VVDHEDIGRTVLCSRGLGTLERVRYSAGMKVASVKLRTGGYTGESVRRVEVYEEATHGNGDTI